MNGGNNTSFDDLPPEIQQNIRNILLPNQSASRYIPQRELDKIREKVRFARLPEDAQKMVKRDLVLGRAHLHRLRTGEQNEEEGVHHRRRRRSLSRGRRIRNSRSRSRSRSRRRNRSGSSQRRRRHVPSPHRRRRNRSSLSSNRRR